MATISTLAVNLIARTASFDKGVNRSRNVVYDFERQLKKNAKELAFQRSLDELTTRLRRLDKSLNKVADNSAFGKAMKKMRVSVDRFKRTFKDIIRGTVVERSFKRIAASARYFKASLIKLGSVIKRTAMALKGPLLRGLRMARAAFRSALSGARRFASGVMRWAKIAAAALIGIGIASVKMASDVIETNNLFTISMGKMADSANAFAKSYSLSLGLFENETKKSIGTFQLILTSMGLTEDQAYEMAKGLTRLTNDIASFRNLKPEEVFAKLQGGITGEIRPLRNIGILINETTVKQLAMNDATVQARLAAERAAKANTKLSGSIKVLGSNYKIVSKSDLKPQIDKVTEAVENQSFVLTEVEKIMLRYKAIVNATGKDTGDMARTLDDTANVFRVIVAQVKRTAVTIGNRLLPVVTKAGIIFRDWLFNNQALFDKWAAKAASAIDAVIKQLNIYFELAKAGKFEDIFKDIGRIFGKITDGLIRLFEKIRPIAVDIGSAMAEGFIKAVEGTKLGKAINFTGDAIGGAKAVIDYGGLSGERGFAEKEGRRLEDKIGSIMDRANQNIVIENRNDPALLAELKAIRAATEENIRRF